MATNSVKLKTFGACFLGVLVLEVGLGKLNRLLGWPVLPTIALLRVLEIGLILAAVWRLEGGLDRLGLDQTNRRRGVRLGLIVSAIFGALAGMGMLGLYLGGQSPMAFFRMGLPSTLGGLALYLAVGGVIAPIAEELAFRGVVYGVARPLGIIGALAFSTGIFVWPHMYSGAARFYTQAVGGIVFALAYEYSRSIITPIIVHTLGNLALFGLGWLASIQ